MMAIPYDIDDKDLVMMTEVDPDQPAKDFTQIVIPPGQTFSGALTNNMVMLAHPALGHPLPTDYAKEVADGKRPYYVVGALFYRDAVNAKHVTGFCLIYDANIKQLRQYEKHNYMK